MTDQSARGGATELEAIVLAVIWEDGPVTAYAIQQQFRDSLASTWRASTGSIYPLIRRLTKAGLIEAAQNDDDRRGSRQLRITAAGRKVVREWLHGAPSWLGDATADPIRSRINRIGLAPAGERLGIVDQAIAQTRAAAEALEAGVADRIHKPLERLAYEGALAEVRARLEWLKRARREIGRLSR